ncbi:V-type ATP synthase subunit D [Geobacter sp. FeAm09]|uniref:V-type ATP synthase subunit D n=1 Tax=Geobacter sp. FeAm09 TaxID=2597769 RepID=UPI0011ED4F80|nr:V-type ATP synthase subunit D [Geobacter sp. FeAm09]QEM67287.1 V-type ATP synthase subunit D [Geobacter sp. FeAm09]
MIHPTRTNLLLLKEKARSVAGSVGILTARRLALIREILAISTPFLQSRAEVKRAYTKALTEIALAGGLEGDDFIGSLPMEAAQDVGVEVGERNVMGLRYREIQIQGEVRRPPDERGYDCRFTTPHLEEAIGLFEEIVAEMLEIAAFEVRMKRLGEEVVRVTRRIRVLEERVLPGLKSEIRAIAHYIGERERESFYRLKRFKEQRSE